MNDDRQTSRCLRTTVSAHHAVFPSISSSVCWALSFLFSGSIQISPRLSSSFFFPLPVVISHHSLSSSLCFFLSTCSQHTFAHFSLSTAASFLALHLFFSLQSCLEIIFLLRENQALHTHDSTDLLPPTHTHRNVHTAPRTHKKNSNTENMQQNSLQCSWVYLCVLICRTPGWPH